MKSKSVIVRELLNDVSLRFAESKIVFGHGTESAFDEAVYLVFSILDLPFNIDDDRLNQKINSKLANKINKLVEQRIVERKPVGYLVKKAWFSGLPFYVDERVLIPRSPIAELIQNQFKPWLNSISEIKNILDLGTGSGCIAITAALTFPQASVDATDISDDALKVAQVNLATYDLNSRVKLIKSDLFHEVSDKKYDLIISNPPYVSISDMKTLPMEYRQEPQIGLVGGEDGLKIIRRIIADSKKYLSNTGMLVVEVGNNQQALEVAFPNVPFTWLEIEYGGEGVFLLMANDLI